MPRTRLPALLALILLLAGCELTGSNDDDDRDAAPQIEETLLTEVFLQTAMTEGLRGTVVRLNNYGDKGEEQEDSWQRSDDALVRLSPTLGGDEFRFTIAESRTDVGPVRLLYYVNDVNALTDRLTAFVADDTLAVLLTAVLPLEEEGAEFKGHCLLRAFGGVRACLGGSDGAAPDVQLRDGRLALTFRPLVLDGDLALDLADVAFEGTVQAGGVCNLGIGGTRVDICNAVAGYKDDLRTAFQTLALDALGTDAVRQATAAGLRPFLDALGIGEVMELRREGSGLVVVHRPAR